MVQSSHVTILPPPPVPHLPSTKRRTSLKGDTTTRIQRLSSLPDIYTSPNAAVSCATGPSKTVHSVLDEVQRQGGEVLKKHILSESGRRLAQDVRLLADSTQKTLNEKFDGGKLVEELWSASKGISISVEPDNQALASLNEADTTGKSVLHILKLFITSTEFRRLVSDFFDIFHDQVIGWAEKPKPSNPNASSESLTHIEHDSIAQSGLDRSVSNMSLNSHKSHAGRIRHTISQVFPKENRQTLASRIKAILTEVESNPEYSPALQFILKNVGRLANFDVNAAESEDDNISRVFNDVKLALENFAGGMSLDALLLGIKDISLATADDVEVQEFWQDIKTFMNRSLKDSEFVKETNYDQAWSAFVSRGRSLLYDNPAYRETLLKIADEADMFTTAVSTDATTTTLRRSFSNLWKDAFLDDQGRPVLKLDLLQDLRRVLPSIFKENLAEVSLPRIEYSDNEFDYFSDNIVIHADEILPKYIVLDVRTAMDTTNPSIESSIDTFIRLQISEMHVSSKNIEFGYKKKTGFPHIREHGLVDFSTAGGKGIQVDVLIQPNFAASKQAYRVVESHCNIRSLNIRLHDTKHAALNKMVTPFITRMVKKKVCEMIEERLQQMLGVIGDGAVFVGGVIKQETEKLEQKAENRGLIQPVM